MNDGKGNHAHVASYIDAWIEIHEEIEHRFCLMVVASYIDAWIEID